MVRRWWLNLMVGMEVREPPKLQHIFRTNRLLAKLFGIGDFSPEQDEAKAIGS